MTLDIQKQEEDNKTPSSPHLALTHELQNGAANRRNVALLLKADAELDDEAKAILKSLLGDSDKVIEQTEQQIEKASYNATRKKLENAIKTFHSDRYSYSYVEDFDDENVVFYTDGGIFYTTYSLSSDGEITLGDIAYPANSFVMYESTSGKLLMSDSTKGNGDIPEGVRSLIVKSFDSLKDNDTLKSFFKSQHEKEVEKNMQLEELQKALDDKNADLLKATQENEALKQELADLKKAAEDRKQAERLASIKEVVVDEEEASTLLKSLETLSDEAFATVLKSMKTKNEAVENGELFKQVSKAAGPEVESSATAELLKKKYAAQ